MADVRKTLSRQQIKLLRRRGATVTTTSVEATDTVLARTIDDATVSRLERRGLVSTVRNWELPLTKVANTGLKGNSGGYLDGFTMGLPSGDFTVFFIARVPSTSNTNWPLLSVGNSSDTILTDAGNIHIGVPANGTNAALNFYPWTFSCRGDDGNYMANRAVTIFGAANLRAIMGPSGVNNTPDNVTRLIAFRRKAGVMSMFQQELGTTAREYNRVVSQMPTTSVAAKPARLGAFGTLTPSGTSAIEYQMFGRVASAVEPWQLEAVFAGVDPRAVISFSAAAEDLLFAFSGQAADGATYTDLIQGQVATAHGTWSTNPQLLPTNVVTDQALVELDRYRVISKEVGLVRGRYTGSDCEIQAQLRNEVNGTIIVAFQTVAVGQNGQFQFVIPADWSSAFRVAGYRMDIRKVLPGTSTLIGQSNFLASVQFHIGINVVQIGQSTAKGMIEGAYTPTGSVANACSFFAYGDGDISIGYDEALLPTGYSRKVQSGQGEAMMSQYIGNTNSIMVGQFNTARSGSSILEWLAPNYQPWLNTEAVIRKDRPHYIGPWNQGINSLALGLNYGTLGLDPLYERIKAAASEYTGWYFLVASFDNNYSSGVSAAQSEAVRTATIEWCRQKNLEGDMRVVYAGSVSDHPFEGMRSQDGIHPLSTGTLGYALNAERWSRTINYLFNPATTTSSAVGPVMTHATWDGGAIVDVFFAHNGGTALQTTAGGAPTGFTASINGFSSTLSISSTEILTSDSVRITLTSNAASAPAIKYQAGRPGTGITTANNGLDNSLNDNRTPYVNTTRGFPVMPTTYPIQSVYVEPELELDARGIYLGEGVPPTTGSVVFTPSATLNQNDNNPNTFFRVVATLSADLQDQVRFIIQGSTAHSMEIVKAGFGKQASGDDSTAPLVEVTWGSSNIQFTADADKFLVSDWIDVPDGLDLNAGDELVFDIRFEDSGGLRYSSGNTNVSSYFSTDVADVMTVTPNPAMTLSANVGYGVYRIETRTAINPLPDNYIPLSFDDPIFDGAVEFEADVMSSGRTLIGASSAFYAEPATVTMQGNNRLSFVRIGAVDEETFSRECIRIGGSGTFEIDHCYLEATGIGDDHADTIQCYSPGGTGDIVIRNSMIVAHNSAATAGFFSADNYAGSYTFENVVFKEGPRGLRIHADERDLTISMTNVYFVGEFADGPLLFVEVLGNITITHWENVRLASIVDGVLVPGEELEQPVL